MLLFLREKFDIMAYIKKESMRSPEFCAECPAVAGMANIAVACTTNPRFPINEWVVGPAGSFPDPVYYAFDPENPLAGAVILGKDYTVDPFCGCHEYPSSQALSVTHELTEACQGPKEVPVGIIRRRTKTVCGAGFINEAPQVRRLNRIGGKTGSLAINSTSFIVPLTPRTA